MTDIQNPADQRQASDKLLLVGNLISSVVENPTQEVGTVIDLFKAVLNKISKPEDVVSKFSKNTQLPSHKDPAAIVMKSMHG